MLLFSRKKKNPKIGKTVTLKDVREAKHVLALFKALDQQQHNICLFEVSDDVGVVIADDIGEDFAAAKKKFGEIKKNEPNKACILLVKTPYGGLSILDRHFPSNHFPKNERSVASAQKALRELKEQNLIEESVQENDWLYIFGYKEEMSQPKITIKWMASKESFRYFLCKWFEKSIENDKLKISTIGAITPQFFLTKKGVIMNLANKRKEDSNRYDIIDEIFRHIEND